MLAETICEDDKVKSIVGEPGKQENCFTDPLFDAVT